MNFNRAYGRFQSREHSNLDEERQRVPNTQQEFRNERQRNLRYREFNQGREAEHTAFQYRSLSDQRAQVNESKVRRGNVRYRRNFRNQNAGRERNRFQSTENFNELRNEVSDSESVSSARSFRSNRSDKSDSSSSRCYKKQHYNESGTQNWKYNPRNENKYSKRDVCLENEAAFEGEASRSSLTEKLSVLQNTKQDLKSILQTLQPSDIIMYYRQQVENLTKECIAKNLKKIERIKYQMNSVKDNTEILKLHLNNLIQQQKQFEDYITDVKLQFSNIYCSDTDIMLKSADSIEMDVQCECKLFKRSLPGYGLKGDIIREVKKSQVVIIATHNSYFLNVVLPLFIIRIFPEHFLICCEPSVVLKESLEKNVLNSLNCQLEKNISDKGLINNVAFMTENEMLDYCSDELYNGRKLFVILNLPLKRSIVADLLLANLYGMLEKDVTLIVLLSSCAGTQIYENYFSQVATVSTLETPCLILPVKTIWKKTPSYPMDDYVDQTVKTALAIHTVNEPEGDILAFLPNITDSKSASCKLNKKIIDFQYNDIECIIIHENSSDKPCLDISEQKKSSKRTVFFTTSCAEMLNITSVRYVIDSGIKKDFVFDSKKNLDVLTISFNSHATARIRKSLAGAFGDGVCYRLYNKENYLKEMASREYPELLSVNPFNSLLKIFQYFPKTCNSVQLIEPLPENIRNNALKDLIKYNAIKDGNLTTLGKKIIKLPYPTKYSKLILLGIHWGIAYEAVVLVGFFSVKGRVFQYSDDIDKQRMIDSVKLQLSHNDSDTLTYLYVFKTWVDNDCSSSWCEDHYINFDTLKSVYSKVTEICHKVEDTLKENVLQEFSNEDCASHILEMIFECFHDNLCVFTGHYRSGFQILSSHCIAFLHPSSVICHKENLPQFIVFDHMCSTTRDFLVDITTIPVDFVKTAKTNGLIEFDSSDMFERRLIHQTIDQVGERIIKQVLLGRKGKRLREIEETIKKEIGNEYVVVEPLAEKGCVIVYALQEHIYHAVDFVNKILKSKFQDLINAEKVHTVDLIKGHVRVPIEVKLLKGVKVESVKVKSQGSLLIQNNLDSGNMEEITESAYAVQHSINLTWIRRLCNGKGYVTFENSVDFMRARKLSLKYVPMLGTEVFVEVSNREKNQLYIREIPPDAKVSDVKNAFKSLFPGIKTERVELIFEPGFETTERELKDIKIEIQKLCEEYTDLTDFDIVVPCLKPTATIGKAFINVSNNEYLEHAAEQLSNSMIGGRKINSKPVYRSTIKCSTEVCKALRLRFKEKLTQLECKLKKNYTGEDLFNFDINAVNEDTAVIKLLSNHNEIIKQLQRTVNDLLEGEILNKYNMKEISKLFCHGGHIWLRTLEKTVNIYIIEDYKTKIIRLYGSQNNCNFAKKRIMEFLDDTENEALKTISLSAGRNNRILLKAIIREYGTNLERFIETCELRTAILDIKSCSLSLLGSQTSIENAEECLKELYAQIDSVDIGDMLSSQENCPVCAYPALNLPFRLEYCGHLYCHECVKFLVEQAQFPIQCCAENCDKDIVLDDINKILGDDKERINLLVEKAMKNYLEQHQLEIMYCPAPDCSMFFYKNELYDTKLNCPLCQNDICVKCEVVFHQGYTCNMYQGSKNDPDYSFKVWQKAVPECKQCPRCKMAIERSTGCDHMTCTKCHAHFCWVCVQEFPTGVEVYNHIPFCKMYPKW